MGDDSLEIALAHTLEQARMRYAAWRPEVAAYLFEHGWKKTARALTEDPQRALLLQQLWTLQMESIGTRTFGVSTDAWRNNQAYPDRYFPLLWLELVPSLLPKLQAPQRLSTLVALFNLGEHLSLIAHGAGGVIAEALQQQQDAIVEEGIEAVALSVLVEFGLLPPHAITQRPRKPLTFRRVERIAVAFTGAFDPTFIPGAVRFGEGSALWVAERQRPLALQFGITGHRLQHVGTASLPLIAPLETLPQRATVEQKTLELRSDGSMFYDGNSLGILDVRGLCALAIHERGFFAVTRRFSQRVELWRLRA